jgi:hypothetical protein
MRYAIIKDGVVKNVVLADAEYASQQGWLECTVAGPSWTYANGVFSRPVVETTLTTPTKEQLLAELETLTAKINALG